MAIIVKEEKKGLDVVLIAIIGGVVAVVAAAIYYVFFSPAPLVENIPAPKGYEEVVKISKIKIDAEGIVNSPAWQFLELRSEIPSLDIIITSRRINPLEPIDGSTQVSR